MQPMLCQRCQPWNVYILFFENAQGTSRWYRYLFVGTIWWEECLWNCLVNTDIQTFLPHGNKLLFAKNDNLTWAEHDKTVSEDMQVDRDFATALAYLRLRPYRYEVRSNPSATITLWSGDFHFFVWLNPAYLCGYSFAKVLSALPNVKPGTANLPQTSWAYLLFPHLPYCLPTL